MTPNERMVSVLPGMSEAGVYERTTDSGWRITARPEAGLPTWKIIAISPEGKRCIHRDHTPEAELATYSPEAAWGVRR